MGFSIGSNSSKSSSSNESQFGEDVWGPQGAALGASYNQLSNQWGQMNPMMNFGMGMMSRANPYMYGAADYGMNQANYMGGGGSYGDTSDVRDSLYSSLQNSLSNPSETGKMYESIVGGPGNTYIDPMVASMKEGMQQNLNTMESGVGMDAAQMGQGGSNRHAMQNAMLGKQVNMDMANMENQMRGNAYDTDLDWKMKIAGLADQGTGDAQDRMMNILSGGDSNRSMGMNYMPTQQNLGMGTMAPWLQSMQAPMDWMGQYSTMFGQPTTLSSGTSSGTSTGKSSGFNAGAGTVGGG